MSPNARQIERAWQLLEDGAALEEVRGAWDRLVAIRRELDAAVYALAQQIEYLRIEAQKPLPVEAPEPEAEPPTTADEAPEGARRQDGDTPADDDADEEVVDDDDAEALEENDDEAVVAAVDFDPQVD